MKTTSRVLFLTLVTLGLMVSAPTLKAQLVIPSDGSDGDLIVATNTVIDLSRAVTGSWDSDNTANKGKGIYDSNKWAVVFKYSSVTISNGATLSFANHASRAPVVWLVKGDVVVRGVLSLDGGRGSTTASRSSILAEPGPGGFRGGPGFFASGVADGAGFGPGGGQFRGGPNSFGAGGSFGSRSPYGPSVYGNSSLIPLIGGSGGGGYSGDSRGGGAGAGAILIASSATVSILGGIHANGGGDDGGAGSGSGGGVRIVANVLTGDGVIQCLGGRAGSGGNHDGGLGRIVLERSLASGNPQINPDPRVVPLEPGAAPLLWLPENGPVVRVLSVGGKIPPADPRAAFGSSQPDVSIPSTSTTPVILETTNVEDLSTVTVRVTPRANGSYTETKATVAKVVSTTPLVIQWTANVPVNAGYSAMQVKVIRP